MIFFVCQQTQVSIGLSLVSDLLMIIDCTCKAILASSSEVTMTVIAWRISNGAIAG